MSAVAYLMPKQVAELLRVHPVTVRQWVAKGWLASRRTPGGHSRFLLSDLEAFATSRGITLEGIRITEPPLPPASHLEEERP